VYPEITDHQHPITFSQ